MDAAALVLATIALCLAVEGRMALRDHELRWRLFVTESRTTIAGLAGTLLRSPKKDTEENAE